MNDQILQNIWEYLKTQNQISNDFETWKKNIVSNSDVQQNVYNYLKDQNQISNKYQEWLEKTGLQKPKGSSFTDPVTESVEEADLAPPEGEVEEETEEINTFTPDTENFSIDNAAVDEDTFKEYSSLVEKEKIIEADPFQNALSQVNSKLFTQEEEELVPDLNYRFEKYGFNFNQAVVGRERVKVTSTTINPETGAPYEIIIKTDQKDEGVNQEEANKLQQFLRQHKNEGTHLDKLENNLKQRATQYQNDEEIDNSFKRLNIESEAFNGRVKVYLVQKREYDSMKATLDSMSQGDLDTPIGKAFQLEVEQRRASLVREKTNLHGQDVILNNKGVEIDRLVGRYSEMKAKKGSFLGATWKSITSGQSRISSGVADYTIDLITGMGIGKDVKGYEKQFKKRAEELGYYKSSEKLRGYDTFEEFKSTLSMDEQEEIDAYLLDMSRKSSKYGNVIYNEDGSLEFEKVDAGTRYSQEYLQKNIKKITEDGFLPIVREGLTIAIGNDATSDEYIDLMREGFWGGAWIGLSESLPAMLGPTGKANRVAGMVQRTTQMFSQVSDHLNEEMMNDPDFEKISEMEKKAVSLPIGIAVGALEAVGFRNVINQRGLLNKIVLQSLGKYKGLRQTQGLTFAQVVRNEINSSVAKGALIVGAGGLAEFETGVAQEIADIGGKMIYNALKEADLFQTPESLSDGVRQVLYAGAQEAVGGWVMSSIPATGIAFSGKDYTALSDPMFETFESISDDNTYFKANTQSIKNQINQGVITKEEGQAQLDLAATMRSIIPKVPKTLSTENRKKAVALLYNKAELEKSKKELDPSLTGKIDDEISKIDTQLERLIKGAMEVEGTEGRVDEEEKISDDLAIKDKDPVKKETYGYTVERTEGQPDENNTVDVVTNKDGSRTFRYRLEDGSVYHTETVSKNNTLTNEQFIELNVAAEPDTLKLTETVEGFENIANKRAVATRKKQLKQKQDADKKSSTVEKTGTNETKTTKDVAGKVSSKIRKPSDKSATEDKNEIAQEQEKKIEGDPISKESEELESIINKEAEQEEDIDTTVEEVVLDKSGKVILKKDKSKAKDTPKNEKRFARLKAFAAKVANATKVVLPKLKIVLHETSQSFNKTTGRKGRGYISLKDLTIHVDMTRGTKKTIAHETFHALLYNSIKSDALTQAITKRMVSAVAKAKGLTQKQKRTIKEFVERYDEYVQNEEKLAEVLGILSEGYTKLDAPTKSVIRKWIEKIAKKLGINISEFTKKDQDVIDLLNTIAGKLQTGEEITQQDIEILEPGELIENAEGVIPDNIVDDGNPINLEGREQKSQIDRGGIDMNSIKRGSINNLSGTIAFVFAADQATYGNIESPSGTKFMFNGGYLYPYGSESQGSDAAWAFADETAANKVSNKVKESDGVGLVMSQVPTGVTGNLEFYDFINAEVANAVEKGASPKELINYINQKLKLTLVAQGLKAKGLPAQISSLEELQTLLVPLNFEQRGSFTQNLLSKESYENFGISPFKPLKTVPTNLQDVVNDPSLKQVQYGDIVSAIQFEQDGKPFKLKKGDPGYHPAYPWALPGKPLMVFNNAVDVRKVYPNAVPAGPEKTAKRPQGVNKTPLGKRNRAQAARSAMGGQYVAKVPEIKTKNDKNINLEWREQKEENDVVNLAERYRVNRYSGFIEVKDLFNPPQLRKQLEALGLGLGVARDREGTGQITGYYFQRYSRTGKPYKFNPYGREQKQEGIFNKEDSPTEIIKEARQRNFSDAAISNYLKRVKNLKAPEIKSLMEVSTDLFNSIPIEFGKVEGGMQEGMQLYEEVDSQLQDFAADKKNKIGDIRAKAIALLKENPIFKKQSKVIQDELIVALDRTLKTTANKNVQQEISKIKNRIKEKKITSKNIAAAKTQVKNFITQNLPVSKLYSQDKINRLLKIVSDATVDSYPADIQKVLEIVEKQNQIIKKSLIKQMVGLVRKASRKLITKGKARARGLDAKGQQFFKDVKDILVAAANNDIDAMIKIADQLSDTEAINKVVLKESRGEKLTSKEESLLNKLLAFDTFGDVLNMDIAQLQALINDLKNAKTQSILNLKARRLLRAKKYESLEKEVTDQIKQDYPNLFDKDGNLKDDNELRQDQNEIWEAFRKLKIWSGLKKWASRYDFQTVTGYFDWFRSTLAHIGTLTNIIDNIAKGNTFLFDNIYMKVNDMNTKSLEGYHAQLKVLDRIANSLTGITKGYKQFLSKIITSGVINLEINGKKEIYTKDQLVRIYALSKNEIQRKKLNAQGFTNEKLEEIQKIIGKDAVSFVDQVVDYFSNEYFESVNDVYKQVNDASLGYVSNYFPTKTLGANATGDLITNGDFSRVFSAETAPALKERSDTEGKVNLNDSFSNVLNEHLKAMERFKAYAEGVKTLNAIFKIPSLNTLLEQTGIKKVLKLNLSSEINRSGASPTQNTTLDTLMTRFVEYALSFKVIQIAKQATSFINAFEDYSFRKPGSKRILLGIPDAALDLLGFMIGTAEVIVTLPKQMKKAWNISPDFKQRVKEGLKGDVYGLESGTNKVVPISNNKAFQMFKAAAASPTILGDILGVMGYMVNYNQNIRNGMSKADALRAFNMYNATQQTRRGAEKSAIQNSASALTRAFTMFGSTLFLQMNKVASSMSNIYKMSAAGKVARAKDIRALVINYGLANVLFVATSNIFKLIKGNDKDEEDAMQKIKEAMMGLNLMYQLPLMGGFLEAVYNKINNVRGAPPQDVVNPYTSVFKKISKALTAEGVSFQALRPVLELIIGAQVDPFVGLYNSFRGEGDPEQNLYDILGISSSYQPTTTTPKGKNLTNAQLKKYFPDIYREKEKIKKEGRIPKKVQQQIDVIKREQERLRKEALQNINR